MGRPAFICLELIGVADAEDMPIRLIVITAGTVEVTEIDGVVLVDLELTSYLEP